MIIQVEENRCCSIYTVCDIKECMKRNKQSIFQNFDYDINKEDINDVFDWKDFSMKISILFIHASTIHR